MFVSEDFLNAGAEDSNRSLEMMRRIGGKPGALFEAALQTLKGVVQHFDEAGNFISGGRNRETLVETFGSNFDRRLANIFNRGEGFTCDPSTADRDKE